MKRIALQLDLNDNELLEVAVLEAVRALARQVAREEFEKVVKEEIARLIENRINDLTENKYSRNSALEKIAQAEINAQVNEAVKGVRVLPEHILAKINSIGNDLDSRVEIMIARQLEGMDIESYIEKKVQDTVAMKVPQAILDLMIATQPKPVAPPTPFPTWPTTPAMPTVPTYPYKFEPTCTSEAQTPSPDYKDCDYMK